MVKPALSQSLEIKVLTAYKSCFTLMFILKPADDDSYWVPATHGGDLNEAEEGERT